MTTLDKARKLLDQDYCTTMRELCAFAQAEALTRIADAVESIASGQPQPACDYDRKEREMIEDGETIIGFDDEDDALRAENARLQEELDKAHAQLTETTGLLENANCELESMFAELPSIVEQLRSCVYACEAGPLTGNVAFVRLEQLARSFGWNN